MSTERFRSNLWKISLHAFLGGVRLFLPIQYVFFRECGLDFTAIAFIPVGYSLGVLLFEVPSGVFADHWGRRNALALSGILFALGYLLLAVGHDLTIFVPAMICYGAAEAFISGSNEALLYASLAALGEERSFGEWFGRAWGWWANGFVVGSFGASLLASLNVRWMFVISAGFALGSLVVAATMEEPPLALKKERAHYWRHLRETARFVFRDATLRSLFWYCLAAVGSVQIFFQFIQFALEEGGVPQVWFGVSYAGFIFLCGRASAMSHRIAAVLGRRCSLLLIPCALVGAYVLCGAGNLAWTALAGTVLLQLTFGFSQPLLSDLFNERLESAHRATAVSLRSFGTSLAVAVGAPLFGVVADGWGWRWALVLLGVVMLPICLGSLRAVIFRAIRKNDS